MQPGQKYCKCFKTSGRYCMCNVAVIKRQPNNGKKSFLYVHNSSNFCFYCLARSFQSTTSSGENFKLVTFQFGRVHYHTVYTRALTCMSQFY